MRLTPDRNNTGSDRYLNPAERPLPPIPRLCDLFATALGQCFPFSAAECGWILFIKLHIKLCVSLSGIIGYLARHCSSLRRLWTSVTPSRIRKLRIVYILLPSPCISVPAVPLGYLIGLGSQTKCIDLEIPFMTAVRDLDEHGQIFSSHQPCHLRIIVDRHLTDEQAFSRHREAAHITTSAVLRDWITETNVEDRVATLDALKRLPNLRTLRMRLSREATDAMIAADLPLEKLHTLYIEVPTVCKQVLVAFLSKLSNLRTLEFCPRACNVSQNDPAPPAPIVPSTGGQPLAILFPHLRAYTQTTNFSLYREPMDAAWRTLRSVSVCSSGTLPNLNGLVALSRLTIRLFPVRDDLRVKSEQSLHASLLGCRRLRHLDISSWLGADPFIDALAVLVRQLATLKLRFYGPAMDNCPILAAHVPRFFAHDAPSALRSLVIEVQVTVLVSVDKRSIARLERAVTPVCRARRIPFFLGELPA